MQIVWWVFFKFVSESVHHTSPGDEYVIGDCYVGFMVVGIINSDKYSNISSKRLATNWNVHKRLLWVLLLFSPLLSQTRYPQEVMEDDSFR